MLTVYEMTDDDVSHRSFQSRNERHGSFISFCDARPKRTLAVAILMIENEGSKKESLETLSSTHSQSLPHSMATAALTKVSAASEEFRKKLAAILSLHGFDICHLFHTQWYNQLLDNDQRLASLVRLPVTGNAFLIGNTKRLWPCFLTWLKQQQLQQPDGGIPPNPLDTYVSQQITTIIRQHVVGDDDDDDAVDIFWDHEWDKDKLVSMSRVASVSGLCYLHPSALLCIHPTYGAWFSLRAVVVVHDDDDDDDTAETCHSPPPPPPLLCNPLSPEQDENVQAAARRAFDHHANVFDDDTTARVRAEEAAQPWIQLRDAVSIGREYRFSDNQLHCHYLKDTRLLVKEMAKIPSR